MAERQLSAKVMLLYRGQGDAGVASIAVTSGGSSYESVPTVTITGGGGSGATATAVLTSDAVTSITVNNQGTGYETAPTVTLTGGGGAGATATATIEAETFDLIACSTSHSINQSGSTITAETFCGTLKTAGPKTVSVPFALIPNIDPDAGKVAINTLQDDYANDVESTWKMTTAAADTGDPIFTFRGFISELNYDASGDYFNMSGTIEVDEDGVALTFAS